MISILQSLAWGGGGGVYKYGIDPRSARRISKSTASVKQLSPIQFIMKVTILASAILALINGALALPANTPTLDVTLTQVDNTRIKATVKNTGNEKVTFVHLNFFQDAAPVKKVSLFRNGISSEVPPTPTPRPNILTSQPPRSSSPESSVVSSLKASLTMP